MAANLSAAGPLVSREDLAAHSTWRTTVDTVMTGLMFASVVVVVVPLLLVAGTVIARGAPIALTDFPAFFLSDIPLRARQVGPGIGPAIVGTLVITFTAAAMAIPLGILGAIWLQEYGKDSRAARVIRFVGYVMTGVPSIVMGLFVYLLFTLTFGLSAFGGALALACLMLPIVLRSAEEMLRLVPSSLRDASLALGTSKSRTILSVVLPAALPGVVSGSLLAVARASGETAPLLFTIGAATGVNANVFSGANTALSAQIFANAISPFAGAQERAWGAALTLITLTFLLTVLARRVTARFVSR